MVYRSIYLITLSLKSFLYLILVLHQVESGSNTQYARLLLIARLYVSRFISNLGLSRTPDNPSEGPPIQMIDSSFRPRNSTAPQPSIEYMYQQKHFPAQKQRSNNMPPSSRIEFSVKLSLRAAQHSFGFLLGDGAIVEKVSYFLSQRCEVIHMYI